ncbi:glycine--tRNA ligase [Halococcus qingdaonensis]|uniref:glycine--tRNA ligase n=1 Tax=Halococcus qingdaonensis TaxID=224402 RepID=UPI002115D2C4|nr:glycine--tRNA ligase [Halococcus qingdaonensis]
MADATTGADADTLAELAKRRGFFFPANEAYGGASGFYTYGPEGAALKRNLEASWRERFVTREDNMEISSPTVTPEPVFEASGHLDGFDDMILECPECGANHRADHLVEDNTDIEEAESFGTDRIAELIAEHGIACPSCGTELAGEPVEAFNLMFETTIGPGSSSPGYLRPETAQGIFVEFPRLAEYARNQLPFGVAQIGHGYRNEISPRRSLIRVREFTMAELEQFVDPESDGPPIERVEDVTLPLYSATVQEGEGSIERMSVAEALDAGVVESEWIAYYLAIARQWCEAVGVDMDRFRYRQHLPDELSHYASDCWDAEAELDGNWIEITGFADRGAYDLSKHDDHSDEAFSVFRPYDEPKTVERPSVEPDMSYLGPEFGADAGDVADELAALAEREPSAFDGEAVEIDLDGEQYTVPTEKTGFAVRTETITGEHVTPHVIEPSFGIGRVLYTVLVHSYREDEVEGESRSYLSLPSELAPTFIGVFPLMDKDGLGERANEIAADLRAAGFAVEYDDSGNIGRRYRRQDEVGTPYCVTVDYESLDEGTVTVRERDSTAQTRIAIDELPARLAALRAGESLVD